MFLKTLKPTKVPGKNLKQLRKQLISELNLGPRINSVHSLWGENYRLHLVLVHRLKQLQVQTGTGYRGKRGSLM